MIDSDTHAWIGDRAEINQDGSRTSNAAQSVNVAAVNVVDAVAVAGAAGIGIAGVSGAVDAGVLRNDTTASIGQFAQVAAVNDVEVHAVADHDAKSIAISLAGGAVGASESVSVWSVGADLDGSFSVDGQSEDSLQTDDGDVIDEADRQST